MGKSRVSEELKQRGYNIITVENLAEGSLITEDGSGSKVVDVIKMDKKLRKMKVENGFVVGHLAHWLSVDMVIVLRVRVSLIEKRLEARGYSRKKARENAEAEAIDLITTEALERCNRVYEIDCSYKSVKKITDEVEEILMGKVDRDKDKDKDKYKDKYRDRDKYKPGKIDFSEEVLNWF